MIQIFLDTSTKEIVTVDVPAPVLTGDGILVRTACSAISVGTDRSIVMSSREGKIRRILNSLPSEGVIPYLRRKIRSGTLIATINNIYFSKTVDGGFSFKNRPMGYSNSGVVIGKHPSIDWVEIGDKVACVGRPHAEVNFVPRNMFAKIPKGVNLENAAFTALGCIAIQGIRRAGVQLGETVVVIGQGLVGLLVTQVLSAIGARVIAIDLEEKKLELAQKIGAILVFQGSHDNLVEKIAKATKGVGADHVLLCMATGSSKPVIEAVKMVRDKGRIVLIGVAKIEIPRAPFYDKELDFLISRSYGPGRYDMKYEEKGFDYPIEQVRWTAQRNMQTFLDLLRHKSIDISSLITHRFPFSDAKNAYDTVIANSSECLGVVLEYNHNNENENDKRLMLMDRKDEIDVGQRKKINIAVIGAGSFASKFHLPNIRSIGDFNLVAVAGRTGYKVKALGEAYGAEYVTCDYREVLEDENIDTVLISTHHDLHAPLAIEALQRGKNVFLEKPMCLNERELGELSKEINESSGKFTIGFNRRFSTLSQKVKYLLSKEQGAMVINYRISGTFSPASSWIHDSKEGGGTIIGECCHFIDFIYWLADANPIRIYAEGGNLSHPGEDLFDNVIITILMDNGSIGVITYCDMGNEDFPKEKIEVFCGGKVAAIDDFMSLSLTGFSGEKNVTLKKYDKGFEHQLIAWKEALLNDKPLPIASSDAIRATVSTFKVMKCLRFHMPEGFPQDA